VYVQEAPMFVNAGQPHMVMMPQQQQVMVMVRLHPVGRAALMRRAKERHSYNALCTAAPCSRKALARTRAGRCSAASVKLLVRAVMLACGRDGSAAEGLVSIRLSPFRRSSLAVTTTVTSTPGCFTWAVAAILCFLVPPCCFIPFCSELAGTLASLKAA